MPNPPATDRRVNLPEVAVFASGRYATEWGSDGKPIAWSDWTDADLQHMAENDAHLRKTGQPAPYIKPSHDAEPVPGFLGPLKYRAGKLYARIEKCAAWIAEQVQDGLRPWRSAEILRAADAANFKGVTGPIFKGLALLNTHPRVKTLDSQVYAENFEEPAAVVGSCFVNFSEGSRMALTGDQTLALLEALGGDQELLAKAVAALQGADEKPAGEEPAAPDAPAAPATEPMQMSDKIGARITALETTNALLRARIEDDEKRTRANITADRNSRVTKFSESVSLSHGAARAETAKAAAAARIAILPALEVFDDKGADRVASIFSDILSLMGPGTAPRKPLAATGGASIGGGSEDFSEENVKAEIFAEITTGERSYLESKEGEGTLKTMVARRVAERTEGEAR